MLKSRLPGGLVDAGLASLATFLVGLYAITAWSDSPELIGVYALFFSAFGMATTLATQLIFIPAEKHVLDLGLGTRRATAVLVARRLAPAVSVCAVLVVLVPAAIVWLGGEYQEVVWPLAVTSFVVYVTSPLQDHVRRLLHLDRAAWHAAGVSAVQTVAAGIGVVVLDRLTGDPAWTAFGALAVANVASLTVGLILAVRSATAPSPAEGPFVDAIAVRNLARSGAWLGSAGVFSTAVNLFVSWLVTAVAGEAALGFAEAARTLAQPIVVVSMGLRSVYGPDSMEAAKQRDERRAASVSNRFLLVLWPLTLVFAAVVGWNWQGNPLADLVPAAYTVSGLIIISVLANALNGASFPLRLELVGADRERALFWTDGIANVAMVVTALVFAVAGSGSLFWAGAARPAGMAAMGLGRWLLFRRAMRPWYRLVDA